MIFNNLQKSCCVVPTRAPRKMAFLRFFEVILRTSPFLFYRFFYNLYFFFGEGVEGIDEAVDLVVGGVNLTLDCGFITFKHQNQNPEAALHSR